MGMQRRRYNRSSSYRNLIRPLIPYIFLISIALLLLLSLLFFLVPSSIDDNHQHLHHHHHRQQQQQQHHHRRHYSSLNNSGKEVRLEEGVKRQLFRVPIGGGSSGRDLWGSRLSNFYYGCSDASIKFAKAEAITIPNRYLMIATSGGLNQQRTGITDAVVAARILNATLVVPKLDQKSFWKDSSNFSEIFDVDWFISFLSKDIKIIKQLAPKGGKVMSPYSMRVPRKCTAKCYQNRVLPVLLKRHSLSYLVAAEGDLPHMPDLVTVSNTMLKPLLQLSILVVVQLTKFDYRLANKLKTDLQKLRCRVNYHALKFTDPIREMGEKLVQRMRTKSRHFIALHLRFEPDMLAFSGCDYGGGDKERSELGAIRKRWKTLHTSNPDKERRHGKCPLTPEEVGLMLRALGFGSDIHIYVASGEVYGGEETLAPLKALFPNYHSKETIASNKELSPFSKFSSRMAALDFIVCDESDVFVTNNNGNMARILAGRRRYFGHKPTIRPNAKKLYSLFPNRVNMTWEAFASKVRSHQRGFMGVPNEVRPGRGEFHENPSTCICEDSVAKAKADSGSRIQNKTSRKEDMRNNTGKDIGASSDGELTDDEPEWSETDYGENQPLGKESNGGDLDYNLFFKSEEEPELEEMLSD